ncbi:hypothetical protein GCM10023353_37500 [Tomitella cavernea]|uniref:Uncharacterized protein n=1 Tax=Tomitella cavernea TaxID=1387982 RepID=A0ABP9D188_9ACTN
MTAPRRGRRREPCTPHDTIIIYQEEPMGVQDKFTNKAEELKGRGKEGKRRHRR